MPVDKQVQLRYEVLNKCFRDLYREYTIDDLVDACNKAMLKAFDMEDGVSKRTVQNDIANLQMPPYNIRLDENLKNGRKRIYRYYDTNFTLPQFRMNDSDRNKIQAAVNVLENYAGEPLLDWARTLLMQIESGLFGSDSSSVVSFQSNPDLKNISLFGDLLQAILNKKVLKLTYAPFGKDAYEARVYPYHLKQFNDRWYLIAQAVGYDTLGHYALDRIERFEEIDMPYVESEVDFSEYFDELKESMAKHSVESLVEEFNRQVGRRSWTSIRGVHDSLLIDTLMAKGVDVSAIYDGVDISFAKKIALNKDKNKIIFG